MMPLSRPRRSTVCLALLVIAGTVAAGVAGQAASQAPPAVRPAAPRAVARRPAPKPYTLSVRREDGFINVALVASQARIGDVARDLATQLRTRIDVGPTLAGELVTVDLPSGPLESVLQAIAPRVLVDYELRPDARPVPIAIYLLSAVDAGPPMNARGKDAVASHGVVISGHTEETPAGDGADPVTVSGDGSRLSIAAKDQPLSLVAMMVADTIGVTLDMEYAASETIVVAITDLPSEDAVLSLSPNVRLHVRVDLAAAVRMPLRLRLAQPRAQAAP